MEPSFFTRLYRYDPRDRKSLDAINLERFITKLTFLMNPVDIYTT